MIKNHDELHEECGVVAIWGDDNAAQLTYYGLHSLQHRGQEAEVLLSAIIKES